jgi:hypothetical protein
VSVCVALVIQYAKRMRHILFNQWPVQLYDIFPHYLINGMILEKIKGIKHKTCILIFSANVWNISHSGKSCTGGKIEKNEMGRACGAYWGAERGAHGVGGETWRKEAIGETQTLMAG